MSDEIIEPDSYQLSALTQVTIFEMKADLTTSVTRP